MKRLSILLLSILIGVSVKSQTWTKIGTMPVLARHFSVVLTYNNKAYIFCGQTSSSTYTDSTWEYDPAKNSWQALPSFPGGHRFGASGFVIGDTAYVGLGEDDNTYAVHNDFYAFSLISKTWTKKANFTGYARYSSSSFSIGKYGYIIAGSTGGAPYLNDAYRYNSISGKWDTIAHIIPYIESGEGISVDGDGYIIGGYTNPGSIRDIIKYDTTKNVWTTVSKFTDSAHNDQTVFHLCNSFFIATGSVSDSNGNGSNLRSKSVFRYNLSTKKTTKLSYFPGEPRKQCIYFVINGVGYLMSGFDDSYYYNDIWKFTVTDTLHLTDTNFCKGKSIAINTGIDNGTYKWSTGDTTSTINISKAGNYAVNVTTNTCMSVSDSFTVSEMQPALASFSYATYNDTLKFTNSSSNYNKLKWFFGDGDSSTAINTFHKYHNGGNFIVKLIAYNPCGNDTFTQMVQVALGINNVNQITGYKIYPNPTTKDITLEFVALAPVVKVSVTDVLGRVFKEDAIVPRIQQRFMHTISISGLIPGVYFVRVSSGQAASTLKFVKE